MIAYIGDDLDEWRDGKIPPEHEGFLNLLMGRPDKPLTGYYDDDMRALEKKLLGGDFEPEEKMKRVLQLLDPDFANRTSASEVNDIAKTLVPLDEIFIDDYLKDEIVKRVSIPELVMEKPPNYSGVILYGKPGTGKTVFLNAIGKVYMLNGAYAKDVSISSINTALVGEFAQNLEFEVVTAIKEAEKRGKHSFLAFDEGSVLADAATHGATSVSKHYQEAFDVLKRYIGNTDKLVLGISTNSEPEKFDEALTREGRLQPYLIGPPGFEQRKAMWLHFSAKYDLMNLSDEQAENLAIETNRQGAFIEEFCRTYQDRVKYALMRQKGSSSIVDALKNQISISSEEIRTAISFENFYTDLKSVLKREAC